jgi:hypothetical protein
MLSIAALLATATLSAPAAPKPNLLFMMADQLRADALGTGARNGGKPNTPNLDKLGNEGIRFTNSCENMQPCSHAAMQPPQHAHGPCSDDGCHRSQQAQMHCMQSPQHAHSHVEMVVVGAHIKRKCNAPTLHATTALALCDTPPLHPMF